MLAVTCFLPCACPLLPPSGLSLFSERRGSREQSDTSERSTLKASTVEAGPRESTPALACLFVQLSADQVPTERASSSALPRRLDR